ncbi:MAG: glycosyltransferase family 2 protein [Chitinophagaceae bacterium]
MKFDQLSIIIPAYNEARTIGQILEKITQVELPEPIRIEILVIDDCSTDNTLEEVKKFETAHPQINLQVFTHQVNQGKGGAIHSGIKKASGDYLIIQDADLEYDPREFNTLIQPILEGYADVVYGSRFIGGNPHRILFFWHTIGNRFLTLLSNMFTNLNLTDMETGYKMFHVPTLKALSLKEKRFGFEPEVTAKISRVPGIRIYEVGISYYGRTYEEGKKIGWKDGLRAIWSIIKYRFLDH